ncbi:MAG: dTDP-4-dehydrorhamnose 3,5-epimerase [Rhodospirillales bacterium]
MKVIETALPGVLLVEPQVFGDARGYFYETYRWQRYADAGIAVCFVQDNVSYSERGVLRGLHLQNPEAQGKLVHVLEGAVFDVAVDVRIGSPTFGRWTAAVLSGDNKHQLYIPEGFAHGFCVTGRSALVAYKCTAPYAAGNEIAVAWNDPDVAIAWPIDRPALSAKDGAAPRLRDIDPVRLPRYVPDRR